MDNALTSNRQSCSGRNFSINIDIDNDIQELSNSDEASNTAYIWSKYLSCLGICAFAVFTGIVMTAGIMIVCFTSPKHTSTFDLLLNDLRFLNH
jgi:ABC-type transport system involved in multi-copper enzyme maturation permease subunit